MEKHIDVISDTPLRALLKDLRNNSKTLDRETARVLVFTYYSIQDERIVQGNRAIALEKAGYSKAHVNFLTRIFENLENEIKNWLDKYSMSTPLGQWLRDIDGIGPVIAAGMLAYFDITKADYASSYQEYAGLSPKQVKKAGQKINWNPLVKTLCWKLGESFVKVSNKPTAKYGLLYKQRKDYEWAKNLRGEYAPLIGLPKYKYGEDTESYKWTSGQYSDVSADSKGIAVPGEPGVKMIPPASIHARAKRYAVKRFLSDFFTVTYEAHYGKPAPRPWVNEHGGHPDYVHPGALPSMP